MHELATRLLQTIRKQGLIRAGDRVAAAVSGGVDSVALLRLLLELRSELGIVLSIAHVNHKLRGEESDEDERFVGELARGHELEFHFCAAPLNPAASGIEEAARRLRYDFFRQLAREGRVSKIATAHTLDDQAETVLLRILRGTGIRGLAGIHPRIVLEERSPEEQSHVFGEIVRPLLRFRRADLEDFLRGEGQSWRDDSSNLDLSFLRNRMRQIVLPVLKENFGAAATENLADLAEIARAEEEHWHQTHPEIQSLARVLLSESVDDGFYGSIPSPLASLEREEVAAAERGLALRPKISIEVDRLLAMPLASQRRVISGLIAAEITPGSASFRLIEEILDVARSDPGKTINLPAGYRVRRTRAHLCFDSPGGQLSEGDYEYSLPIPGKVEIPEVRIRLQAEIVDTKDIAEAERDRLLDPGRLPRALTVRNWRPGDHFWPAHTREPRKVKELLGDRHLTGSEKKLWPVIVAGGELVWMRGFAVPADFRSPANSKQALRLREHGLTK